MKTIKTLFSTVLLLVASSMFAGVAISNNIALQAGATASSGTASSAIDGNIGTRWESTHAAPDTEHLEWIQLSLDQYYSLSEIVILWEGANADVYSVEVSSDNTNWTEAYAITERTEGDDLKDTITLNNVDAKYIKINCNHRQLNNYGYSIWEIEVYGEAVAGKNASLSMIQVDNVDISGFSAGQLEYNYPVASGTTTIPTVTANTTDAEASKIVTPAEAIPGTTTIEVTSSDETVNQTYKVNFITGVPANAPAAPTHAAEDVISVYSDTYDTNIATNLNPGWAQATVFSEQDFSGNKIMKYANLNYQGLEYTNPTDVNAMEYVHLDYWTADATVFEFYLIAGGENAYIINPITLGEWVSIDIPLSYYKDAGRDLGAAFQFKTVGNGTIYLDNLYFWKNPTQAAADVSLAALNVDGELIANFSSSKTSYDYNLPYGTTTVPTVTLSTTNENASYVITNAESIPDTTSIVVTAQDGTTQATYTVAFEASIPASAAPSPNYNETNVIAVYSDTYTNNIVTNLNPGWGQTTTFSEIQLGDANNTLQYINLDYQGTEYNTANVSGMDYLHFDYWTLDATSLEFFLIAGGENAYNVATELGIQTAQWVSVNIPLSYFANAGRNLNTAIQFKVVGNGTIYLDNYIFWKDTPTVISETKETEMSLYPNPSDDILYFKGNVEQVEVYELTGRLVKRANIVDNYYDISSLKSGYYLIKMKDATMNVKTIHLLKN